MTAQLELHFGDEKSLFGKATAAQMAGGLLGRGTAKHTRQQLQDEMDRLKIQVRAGGSLAGANASVTAARATLGDALRLAAEMLRQPSFPESDFEQSRLASLARLDTSKTDPQSIVNEQRARYVAPYPAGDPRATMTVEERAGSSQEGHPRRRQEVLRRFLRRIQRRDGGDRRLRSGRSAETHNRTVRRLEEPVPYKQITRTWQKLTPVERSTETPDKTNANFAMVSTMAMNQDDPDYLPMVMAEP